MIYSLPSFVNDPRLLHTYVYVANDPVNKIDPLGLAIVVPTRRGNGNFKPGFTPQDGICTVPPAVGFLNRNRCTLKCCQEHDDCYTKYGCNVPAVDSWGTVPSTGTFMWSAWWFRFTSFFTAPSNPPNPAQIANRPDTAKVTGSDADRPPPTNATEASSFTTGFAIAQVTKMPSQSDAAAYNLGRYAGREFDADAWGGGKGTAANYEIPGASKTIGKCPGCVSHETFIKEIQAGERQVNSTAGVVAKEGGTLNKPGPYAGESIPARSSSRDFNAAERAWGNQAGRETGCHTCGTPNPGTRSGNFVLDHQPPTALNPTNAPQRLYPQCLSCSRQQGLDIIREQRR
jgi:hypothetical protein